MHTDYKIEYNFRNEEFSEAAALHTAAYRVRSTFCNADKRTALGKRAKELQGKIDALAYELSELYRDGKAQNWGRKR